MIIRLNYLHSCYTGKETGFKRISSIVVDFRRFKFRFLKIPAAGAAAIVHIRAFVMFYAIRAIAAIFAFVAARVVFPIISSAAVFSVFMCFSTAAVFVIFMAILTVMTIFLITTSVPSAIFRTGFILAGP